MPAARPEPLDRPAFVLTLAMLAALSATTVDLCLPAQPAIAAAYGARPEAGGIVVSAYLLGYGPGQLLWGPLADRHGRMRPLVVGLLGFALLTVACPFAGSLESLGLLRAAQGAFAAAAPVIARAVARDQGGGRRTARLLATIAVIFGAAPLLAPLLGAGLLLAAGWQSQFWFLAALALVLLVAAERFVRPACPAVAPERSSVARYAARAAWLLRQREFAVGCGAVSAAVLGYSTLLGAGAAMTSGRYGLAPAAFGPLFASAAAASIAGSWLSRQLLHARSAAAILRAGAWVSALASAALLVMARLDVPLAVLWSAISVYVLGFGMMIPLANALALEPAGDAAGIGSSLLGALPNLAGAAGAGLAASALFASAYEAICLILAGAGATCLAIVLVGRPGRAAAQASERSRVQEVPDSPTLRKPADS